MERKTKKKYAKGIDWLSEVIDIDVLYRIKGRQGLFMPITKTNKSNLIRMVRFMSNEAHTVNKSLFEGLRGAIIYKRNDKTITLSEAFDNLQKHFKNQKSGSIELLDRHEIMEVICPDYHPEKFRDYHAKKVVIWYNEIVSVINAASN